ncbi:hypothetical protein FQA47_016582 [Oryzias melastigma]|uniref:Uncharacterized protein n=1 Tax=Oryzias melastigma TaxID=30732 RepID=A0A834BP24_ORYME|nr:hypothetical protein FQA47_016582 [Oryzias melastigma]
MPLSLLFLSFCASQSPSSNSSPLADEILISAGVQRDLGETGCSLLYPEKTVEPAMKSHMDVELEREQEEEEEDKEEERGCSLPDGLLPTEPGSRHCVCLCVSAGSGGSSVRHVCDWRWEWFFRPSLKSKCACLFSEETETDRHGLSCWESRDGRENEKWELVKRLR